MTPTFTVYCIRPNADDVGQQASDLALAQRLEEALGSRTNLVWLRGRSDGFGRSGLTSRTVYELNMFGHGLVVCGDTEAPSNPTGALEVEAGDMVGVPLLLCGMVARGGTVAGLEPDVYGPLAKHSTVALTSEPGAGAPLRAAGARTALGGPLALFLDRVPTPPATPSGVLVAVRNPGRLPLDPERRSVVHGEVRTLVDRLRAAGHSDVRLLCQNPVDVAFAASYADLEYAYTADPYRWLRLLRGADLVVSYRLEASLACAASSIPFVHLAADDGARATLLATGLDRWCVDLRNQDDAVPPAMELVSRLESQPDDRVELMTSWGGLDRKTSEAFATFAAAVRDHRDQGANAYRTNAGLKAWPETELAPQETRIDLRLEEIEGEE